MIFIIFLIVILIYLDNQKKVYKNSSKKKTYTYPDKNKKMIDPKVRDLSSKKISKKEKPDNKKVKISYVEKDSNKKNISESPIDSINKKELVIEDVKDSLEENDDVVLEKNKSDFNFDAKQAFIYSEIFNRKY